jgi:hypothetical protein
MIVNNNLEGSNCPTSDNYSKQTLMQNKNVTFGGFSHGLLKWLILSQPNWTVDKQHADKVMYTQQLLTQFSCKY